MVAKSWLCFYLDYETGALEGVEEATDAGEDDKEGVGPVKRGRGRPPSSTKSNVVINSPMQTLLMNMGVIPSECVNHAQ